MNLLTLSLKNLQRRKLRTSLSMTGVAIATAALFLACCRSTPALIVRCKKKWPTPAST